MNLYELAVKITADTSEAENGIRSTGSATEGLSAKTIAMGQIMADAIESVISKVTEYGQKIIDVGMQQETALAKVNTIMDQSKMTTEAMADGITELSSKMGISVSDLSDSVYNIISATGDTVGALGIAEQASKLATAGFTDTSSAVGMLTTAMNVYGDSAGTVEQISDSLMAVQNRGVTTIGELSSSMAKAMATAGAYSVDLANVESAYISLTKQGIPTAESTTYLSSMLKELGDSGSDVGKIINEVTGQTFGQFMQSGGSLADVMDLLLDSVNGDSEALMNLWGSAEAGKSANALLKQGTDYFRESLDELATSTGTTETAFETMSDTLEHKVSIFQTVGENLMSSLYDGLSAEAGGIVEFGTELLTKLTDTFKNGGLDALAYALGDAIASMIAKASEYIPKMLQLGGKLILGIIDGLGDNGEKIAESVMEIIQTLVDGLTENADQIILFGFFMIMTLAEGIGQSLPDLIPSIVNLVLTIVDSLINNADMLVDGAIALAIGLAQGLVNAVPILIEKAPVIITSLVEALILNVPKIIEAGWTIMQMFGQSLIDTISTFLAPAIESIVSFFTQTIPSAVDSLVAFLEKIPEWWSTLPERLAYLLGMALSKVVEWVNQMKEKAPEVKANVIDAIVTFFSTLPSRIWTHLISAVQKFTSWFTNMKNKASTELPTLISKIVDGFKELPSKLTEIGKNVVAGFWNGITGAWDTMVANLKEKIASVKEAFQEGFDVHSPSRWFKWLGEMNTEGFMLGMEDLLNPVGLANQIQRSLDGVSANTYTLSGSGSYGSGAVYNQTINVNQQISTADELARKIRLESRYGLMVGAY